MTKQRLSIDLDRMTLEEREDRIVELLASAAVRMAMENVKATMKDESEQQGKGNDYFTALPPSFPGKGGPVPFGSTAIGLGRVPNDDEIKFINLIYEWNGLGLSSEKIAKNLNEIEKVSKRASKWNRTAVWRILKRRKEP